jgi:hypothetical protein
MCTQYLHNIHPFPAFSPSHWYQLPAGGPVLPF